MPQGQKLHVVTFTFAVFAVTGEDAISAVSNSLYAYDREDNNYNVSRGDVSVQRVYALEDANRQEPKSPPRQVIDHTFSEEDVLGPCSLCKEPSHAHKYVDHPRGSV